MVYNHGMVRFMLWSGAWHGLLASHGEVHGLHASRPVPPRRPPRLLRLRRLRRLRWLRGAAAESRAAPSGGRARAAAAGRALLRARAHLVGDAILFEDLDGDPLAGEQVHAKLDLAKGALADRLRQQIAARGRHRHTNRSGLQNLAHAAWDRQLSRRTCQSNGRPRCRRGRRPLLQRCGGRPASAVHDGRQRGVLQQEKVDVMPLLSTQLCFERVHLNSTQLN